MLKPVQQIDIADYSYDLPDEKIAYHPSQQRDASKLLLYKKGQIEDAIFHQLPTHLPKGSHLVFNETRVVHARLHMQKENGDKQFEVFCLNPSGNTDMQIALQAQHSTSWECMVKGIKKWKSGPLKLSGEGFSLQAFLKERKGSTAVVTFEWGGEYSFGELLALAGNVPLPPYIQRGQEEADAERYQTVFAKEEGSVAAPTASLHFTEPLIEELLQKGATQSKVILHVGAGTFKPVKEGAIGEHKMHGERLTIHINALEEIMDKLDRVIAVGTTAMRTLESVYWLGCQVLAQGKPTHFVDQWEPYQGKEAPSTVEALEALKEFMRTEKIEAWSATTSLLIAPGYTFKVCKGLITNFHQPGSTLLLLVAALIGPDWREVYNHALKNEYRFLSYGDSSLLIP